MNENILKKRNYLKNLSNKADEMSMGTDYEEATVNKKLMHFIYNPGHSLEFRSFKGWRKEGYTVRKGQKSFLLWGRPINKNANKDLYNVADADKEDLFFPIAFVFSSEQVYKIKELV